MFPSLACVALLAMLCAPLSLAQPSYYSDDKKWLIYPPAPYTYSGEPTFAMMNSASPRPRGQWTIKIYIGDTTAPGFFTQLACNNPIMGACFNSANPLALQKAPVVALGTQLIKLTYTYSTTLTNFTAAKWTSMIPGAMAFRMCYSNEAFNDRPWRKKNKAYPRLTQNCQGADDLFELEPEKHFPSIPDLNALTSADKTALSGEVIFSLKDRPAQQFPSATFFFMMWIRCSDGNICAFESTESASTLNSSGLYYPQPYGATSNYVEIKGNMGITVGMEVAAAILAGFGPLFFGVYMYLDHLRYVKTGKALAW